MGSNKPSTKPFFPTTGPNTFEAKPFPPYPNSHKFKPKSHNDQTSSSHQTQLEKDIVLIGSNNSKQDLDLSGKEASKPPKPTKKAKKSAKKSDNKVEKTKTLKYSNRAIHKTYHSHHNNNEFINHSKQTGTQRKETEISHKDTALISHLPASGPGHIQHHDSWHHDTTNQINSHDKHLSSTQSSSATHHSSNNHSSTDHKLHEFNLNFSQYQFQSSQLAHWATQHFKISKSLHSSSNLISTSSSHRIARFISKISESSYELRIPHQKTHIFSLQSMFSKYEFEYNSIFRHLDTWQFSHGKLTTLNDSGERVTVSQVILGVWLHKYPFLLRFVGKLRTKSDRKAEAEFECLDSENHGVHSFSLKSFHLEFLTLLKYFIHHTERISQKGARFGFYDWYGHWVLVQDSLLIQTFISINSKSNFSSYSGHRSIDSGNFGSGFGSLSQGLHNLHSSLLDTLSNSNVTRVIRRSPRISFGGASFNTSNHHHNHNHGRRPSGPIGPSGPNAPNAPNAPHAPSLSSSHNHFSQPWSSNSDTTYSHNQYHQFHHKFDHLKKAHSKNIVIFDNSSVDQIHQEFHKKHPLNKIEFKDQNPSIDLFKRSHWIHTKHHQTHKSKTKHSQQRHSEKNTTHRTFKRVKFLSGNEEKKHTREHVFKGHGGTNHTVVLHKYKHPLQGNSHFFKNALLGGHKRN